MEDTIQIALDIGAGEHVANRSIAPRYIVAESAGSKAGQHFDAAGGARIPNEGQFKLRLRSGGQAKGEGKDIESTFQVAKVTRPLLECREDLRRGLLDQLHAGRGCGEGQVGKSNLQVPQKRRSICNRLASEEPCR